MKTTLQIEFSNPATARKALNSLKQETSFRKRSRAEMRVNHRALLISIEAAEFPAMRATVNSYLRLLSIVFAVLNVTKKEV